MEVNAHLCPGLTAPKLAQMCFMAHLQNLEGPLHRPFSTLDSTVHDLCLMDGHAMSFSHTP